MDFFKKTKKALSPTPFSNNTFYYNRPEVDVPFQEHLRNKHTVVVYGGAKQGKTTLIEKGFELVRIDRITLHCDSTWTLANLYMHICQSVGFKHIHSTVQKQAATASMNSQIKDSNLFGNIGKFDFSAEIGATRETEITAVSMEFNVSETQDIINALKSIKFSSYIVLEDFHYLPRDTQKSFAKHLKAFIENQIPFVISGVWSNPHRLTFFNGALDGLAIPINAGSWNDSQLTLFLKEYADYLNIAFKDADENKLISLCHNDLHTLLTCCQHSYDKHPTASQSTDKVLIPLCLPTDESRNYKNNLERFAKGFRKTEYEMYKRILLVILTSSIVELKSGLSRDDLCTRIQKIDKKAVSLTTYHLKRSLDYLVPLQIHLQILPFLFDYNEAKDTLCIVDNAFIPWLTRQNCPDLVASLKLDTFKK